LAEILKLEVLISTAHDSFLIFASFKFIENNIIFAHKFHLGNNQRGIGRGRAHWIVLGCLFHGSWKGKNRWRL